MRTIALVLVCLALSGCQSVGGGKGVTWYNPATWFSGAAGRASASIEAKTEKAQDKALKQAQIAVNETGEALDGAPQSRQVDTAKDSNETAKTLLDQLAGPLTATETAMIRKKVRLLTSELAEERAKGEALRAKSDKVVEQVSGLLAELAEAKRKNDADLAKAFERENGLANELRNERWWSWFWRITLGLLVIIGCAAFVYVRLTLGGLPTALGKSLQAARATNPALAQLMTEHLDVNLSPAEQKMIRLLTAKI